MFLGRVVGEVVATIKHPELSGRTLLLVQPLNPDDTPKGARVIALDAAQAGVGDRVLVLDEGNGAAQVFGRPRGPVRTVVVGVVDEVTEG
ncbi:MAG: EutN/CcmL family microcompartment protein [Candidatus Eisenbacteria bacterium]